MLYCLMLYVFIILLYWSNKTPNGFDLSTRDQLFSDETFYLHTICFKKSITRVLKKGVFLSIVYHGQVSVVDRTIMLCKYV